MRSVMSLAAIACRVLLSRDWYSSMLKGSEAVWGNPGAPIVDGTVVNNVTMNLCPLAMAIFLW